MTAYTDFNLEQYVNTNKVGALAGEDIFLQDVILAMEFGKLNGILRGPKSTGKTQLMRDVYNGHFGGQRHGLWEMGRADFKPKDLFEKLNLSIARGSYSSLPEIKTVYGDNGKARYLVSTMSLGDSGQIVPGWKEISEQEVKQIIESCSTTTDQLVQLKNVERNFFCIDEYNRCPEVIMNMFYGMMTGEINHDGEVVCLGNGYYSGLGAVNPEDYEGTFKMDAAMWARFHVAIDFAAYPITVADKDELNRRNLSPDVHNSTTRDLTKEIFAAYEKIKAQKLTVKERVILQYFQSALDLCVKAGKSKEIIDWPRHCASSGCDKHTKLCGTVKGLDARAIRAVYRLAKGLEEVVRLKKGREQVEIDSVDSFSLAYQFIAPYKGVLHPKEVKEARGIEALVLAEKIPAIKLNLTEVIDSLEKAVSIIGNTTAPKTLTASKTRFDQLGKTAEYEAVVNGVKQKYTVRKQMSVKEIVKEIPQVWEEKLKTALLEMVKTDLATYEAGILSMLKEQNEQLHSRALTMKEGISKKEFPQKVAKKDALPPLDVMNKKCNELYVQTLLQVAESLFSSTDANTAAEMISMPAEDVQKAAQTAEKELPKKEIEFIPEDQKAQCEIETQKELAKKLAQLTAEKHKAELKQHLAGEKSFLSHFVGKQ